MCQALCCEFRDKQGIYHDLEFLMVLWENIKKKKDHNREWIYIQSIFL